MGFPHPTPRQHHLGKAGQLLAAARNSRAEEFRPTAAVAGKGLPGVGHDRFCRGL